MISSSKAEVPERYLD